MPEMDGYDATANIRSGGTGARNRKVRIIALTASAMVGDREKAIGAGASEMEAYEITLAISEAAGNAIEHAYGPGDASFDVEAALAGRELAATVRDRGSWRARRSEHRGRGLKIIERQMDEVDVTSEPDGTVVRMRRRLDAARAA